MAGSGKKPGAGSVPEADLNLWRKVTQDAKPLAGRRPKEDGPAAAAPAPKAPAPRTAQAAPAAKTPALAAGAGADVDKRTADRLKRGKLPIDGKLDLHGMSQAEAERELADFLADRCERDLRVVLVTDLAAFRRELVRGPVLVLAPDGVALQVDTDAYRAMAVGRRAAPMNLRPRGVLVSRRGAPGVDAPWRLAPARTVAGVC